MKTGLWLIVSGYKCTRLYARLGNSLELAAMGVSISRRVWMLQGMGACIRRETVMMRMGKILVCVACLAAMATVCRARPEQLLRATEGFVLENRQQEGVDKIVGLLAGKLEDSIRPGRSQLLFHGVGADCVRFMELTRQASLSEDTVKWILASERRLHVLVDAISSQDNLPECFRIIDSLAAHDPSGRDDYFKLICAIAVVWDVPGRPKTHWQMGASPLPYTPDLQKRYDYFRKMYKGGGAKIDYSKLSVHELVFVVDTPVPLGELEWARRNVDGSLGSWGKKFQKIEYDHERFENEQYDWPHGPYTLASIQEKGGICVDQAYFCVMTARAFGIPAIYFRAVGKSGGHAWFSYMHNAGKWTLDIGRYENENYTTGTAINPQSNEPMTDHDVEFACERSRKTADQKRAALYMAFAEVLRDANPETALRCARESRRLFSRDLRAWKLEFDLLLADKNYDGLLKLFDDQKDSFRKYPDILARMAQEISDALVAGGRNEDAAELMKSLAGVVKGDRDDIARTVELARIRQIRESGDYKTALREFEQLLEEYVEEGSKVLPLVSEYIDMAKETGQAWVADRFLEEYIEDVIKKGECSAYYEREFYRMLLKAYENSRNKEGAAKIRAKLG